MTYQEMLDKIDALSDSELLAIWELLASSWESSDMYSDGITMLEWAECIYSEISYRNLSNS